MEDVHGFGLGLLVVGLAGIVAVLSNRLSERIRVPAPAIFLIIAAAASDAMPRLGELSITSVERIVTIALVVLLFDGGMHIGGARFRSAAGAVLWIGIAGTLVTAGAVAAAAHVLLRFGWQESLLLGTALAPTDPAVVFSVLGKREIAGRSGTILEGESGANDPVGIALMAGLLAAAGTGGGGAVLQVAGQFTLQLLVGSATGIAGGYAVLWFIRRVPLPSEALYPLRLLACAFGIYGMATVLHGSGFLAVFAAGILLGDERAPYKAEMERFTAALAGLAEIIAFTVLGLTVDLRSLFGAGAVVPGIVLAALLAFVIRPLGVGALLLPIRLGRGERAFVLWAGLKGAVPILLGSFVLAAGRPGAQRLYEVIVVVVTLSVVVQGGLVPAVARLTRLPMRTIQPEPWSVGVRLREEPPALRRYLVGAGAPADGAAISQLPLGEDVWLSFVVRDGELLPVHGHTRLRAGDEVLALAERDGVRLAGEVFAPPPDGRP